MPLHDNDDLPRAFAALTIWDIWDRAHRDGAVMDPAPPQRRDDRYPSPFRDDGRNGSFSVCAQGRGFKDFGGQGAKGGVWHFAVLCWPGMPKGELAKLLIELSGIAPTPPPRPRAPGEPIPAGEIDPNIAAAAKSIARREKAREADEKLWRDREAALRPQMEAKPIPDWPACVAERYAEGVAQMTSDPARARDLAQDRGWPIAWAQVLVADEKISYPWERWANPGRAWSRRHKAFRVDAPEITIAARPDGCGSMATARLRPVGYHQRWFIPAKGAEPAAKGWIYVPSLPKGPAKSVLELQLIDHAAGLGVTTDNRRGLVPALPFVLGNLAGPRLVVLLEGQWDAVTFYGACGYFSVASLAHVPAVFGIRGAQGIDPFLAYWEKWIRHNQPLVWIIADNDEAGASWYAPPPGEPGLPDPPSFAERLKYIGARDVVVSHLKGGEWGKDFNDYYRAAEPTREDMTRWMQTVGIMTKEGAWA